jgi:hypothetical protein
MVVEPCDCAFLFEPIWQLANHGGKRAAYVLLLEYPPNSRLVFKCSHFPFEGAVLVATSCVELVHLNRPGRHTLPKIQASPKLRASAGAVGGRVDWA